jgi:hypothetical protein
LGFDPYILEKTLYKMFTPEWLRDTAKRVKYVQREREEFEKNYERRSKVA